MKGEKPLRTKKIRQRRYTVTCDGLDGMQVGRKEKTSPCYSEHFFPEVYKKIEIGKRSLETSSIRN